MLTDTVYGRYEEVLPVWAQRIPGVAETAAALPESKVLYRRPRVCGYVVPFHSGTARVTQS